MVFLKRRPPRETKRPTREAKRPSRAQTANRAKAEAPKAPVESSVRRLWLVGFLFTILFVALWYRAFELQVIMGEDLAAKATRQHTAKETLIGVRGSILDRNGNYLARSVDSASIWANPQQVQDRATTVAVLAKILEVEPARVEKLLDPRKRFVWVVRKVNDTVAKQVKEASLPGIGLSPEYERVYPYKTLAGQLLGFVNVDDKGIEGLEKALEDTLSSSRIRQLIQRDAVGRRLGSTSGDISDLRGDDIRLTIDSQVQFIAEEALAEGVEKYGAKWGGCLVVDVPTGDILAWAQYPFFDPNKPGDSTEGVRRNRLATDALEQGSTIKSFLIASALEEKVVTPSTEIYCEKGKWKFGSYTIHDTHSYGELLVSKILHVSSNIGVAKIGFKLGAERYHSYLRRLGFGQAIDLPLAGQSRGILRPASKWHEIDTATASFGQSFSTTLAQMAQAYLHLANDGVAKKLRLVINDAPSDVADGGSGAGKPVAGKGTDAERIFSPETMRQVRAMLREVVEEEGGTGKAARIPGIIVGGKTGTAQKADRSGKYGSGRVGSFVGMLPINQPRYLICVLMDEPTKNQYGGIIAAPVFRDVALRTMAYQGLLPDSDDPLVKAVAEKEQQRRKKAFDKNVAGKAAGAENATAQAETEMQAASGPVSVEQKPQRRVIRRAVSVKPSATVPDVVGLGVTKAAEVFSAQGVVPEFQGKGGFVVRQTPAPGSPWPENKQGCVLWLEDTAI